MRCDFTPLAARGGIGTGNSKGAHHVEQSHSVWYRPGHAERGPRYAGEPTGRYNGADGSSPDGAEQVQFANFGNATNSHYMPSDADNIPMGSVPAATADSGTMTHYSPADTAALPPANAKPGAGDLRGLRQIRANDASRLQFPIPGDRRRAVGNGYRPRINSATALSLAAASQRLADDPPQRQKIAAIRHRQCATRILLDHQDADRSVAGDLRQGREQLPGETRRQAQRRLVEQNERRLGHQGAADRHHLLLAAAHRSRFWRRRSARGAGTGGEVRVRGWPARAPRERAMSTSPELKFSATRHSDRTAAAVSGTVAMPSSTTRWGARPINSVSLKRIEPLLGLTNPATELRGWSCPRRWRPGSPPPRRRPP